MAFLAVIAALALTLQLLVSWCTVSETAAVHINTDVESLARLNLIIGLIAWAYVIITLLQKA